MAATQIKEMRPTHDSVLDVVLANPHATLHQLSVITTYSVSWLSQMMRSDCFRAAYDKRRGDIEAEVMMPIQARLNAVAHLAIDRMEGELKKSTDPDFVIDAFDKVLHRAGFAPASKAPAPAGPTFQQNNFYATPEELAGLRGQILEGSVQREEPKALPDAAST